MVEVGERYEGKHWQKGRALVEQWEYDRGNYALKPFQFPGLQLSVSVQYGRDKRCSLKDGDDVRGYPVWGEEIWSNSHTRLPLSKAHTVEVMIYDEKTLQPLSLPKLLERFPDWRHRFPTVEIESWEESVGNFVDLKTVELLLDGLADRCTAPFAPVVAYDYSFDRGVGLVRRADGSAAVSSPHPTHRPYPRRGDVPVTIATTRKPVTLASAAPRPSPAPHTAERPGPTWIDWALVALFVGLVWRIIVS